MAHLIIVNRRPGMIRGGRQHPAVAAYTAEQALDLTPDQLADIAGEPEMTVVVGEIVTREGVPAAIDALAPPAKKGK